MIWITWLGLSETLGLAVALWVAGLDGSRPRLITSRRLLTLRGLAILGRPMTRSWMRKFLVLGGWQGSIAFLHQCAQLPLRWRSWDMTRLRGRVRLSGSNTSGAARTLFQAQAGLWISRRGSRCLTRRRLFEMVRWQMLQTPWLAPWARLSKTLSSARPSLRKLQLRHCLSSLRPLLSHWQRARRWLVPQRWAADLFWSKTRRLRSGSCRKKVSTCRRLRPLPLSFKIANWWLRLKNWAFNAAWSLRSLMRFPAVSRGKRCLVIRAVTWWFRPWFRLRLDLVVRLPRSLPQLANWICVKLWSRGWRDWPKPPWPWLAWVAGRYCGWCLAMGARARLQLS